MVDFTHLASHIVFLMSLYLCDIFQLIFALFYFDFSQIYTFFHVSLYATCSITSPWSILFALWSLIVGMTEDSHYFSWEEMMRPHTLWTRILDTPWTPAIFPSIFRCISNRYSMISTFSGLFRLLDVRAISHIDRTATATYYQSHRSMLHLFHPSYLRPIISLEIEVFSLISHGY